MSDNPYDEWKFKPLLASHGVDNESLLTDLNNHMDKFAEQYMSDSNKIEKAVFTRIRCYILQELIKAQNQGKDVSVLEEIAKVLEKGE